MKRRSFLKGIAGLLGAIIGVPVVKAATEDAGAVDIRRLWMFKAAFLKGRLSDGKTMKPAIIGQLRIFHVTSDRWSIDKDGRMVFECIGYTTEERTLPAIRPGMYREKLLLEKNLFAKRGCNIYFKLQDRELPIARPRPASETPRPS